MSVRKNTKTAVNFLVGWGIAGTSHYVFRVLRTSNDNEHLETLNKVAGVAAAVAVGSKVSDSMKPYVDEKVDAVFDLFGKTQS